jgi:hypothetical protein
MRWSIHLAPSASPRTVLFAPPSSQTAAVHALITHTGYRRPTDDYGFVAAVTDGLIFDSIDDRFLSIGGNTGTTNSFTGVSVADLTGGVFNAQSLRKGNNLWCFAMQAAAGEAPDLLKPLFSSVTKPLQMLNAATNQAIAALGGCPQLSSIDNSQFDKFPGSTKLNSKGTY